jgi:predicted metal-binding membrane protein
LILPLSEKWKRGFIAFRGRSPHGAAGDTSSLLDHPSFQRVLTLILLIELAFAAWAFLVLHRHTTAEMAMRATHFLADWVVMMVAMMFPTAAVMILAFNKAQGVRRPDEAFGSTWVFVTAYLVMWAVAGIVAYAGVRVAGSAAMHNPVTAAQFGSAILLVAGLYQFTPLKEICLSECRTPIDKRTWHHEKAGSFRMGLLHGAYCLGCNWLLFAALFPLGMTIGAMAVITMVILAEKTLPWPTAASYTAGVMLALYGALLIASPQLSMH